MRAEIGTRWADESPHDYIEPDRFCEVLATHGAKRGRWNAPDITLIGGKTLPFLPGKFLDVVTCEVKPWLDITGLYEALSHRTNATHAYLLCHWPVSWGEPDAGEVGRITREAVRTGGPPPESAPKGGPATAAVAAISGSDPPGKPPGARLYCVRGHHVRGGRERNRTDRRPRGCFRRSDRRAGHPDRRPHGGREAQSRLLRVILALQTASLVGAIILLFRT